MYRLTLTAAAKKDLRTLDKRYRSAVDKALTRLQFQPRVGEPLKGDLKGYWKLRFSRYRIIYQLQDLILLITVFEIRHRRDVYR